MAKQMISTQLWSAVLLVAFSTTASAVDCDVALKSSDSYVEVTEKFRCLEKRITALESAIGSTTTTALAPPPLKGQRLIRLESGCFVIPTNLETATERIKEGDSFCSVAGKPTSKIQQISDDKVLIKNADGYQWQCGIREGSCQFNWNVRAQFRIKDIVFLGPGELFAELEFKAK